MGTKLSLLKEPHRHLACLTVVTPLQRVGGHRARQGGTRQKVDLEAAP